MVSQERKGVAEEGKSEGFSSLSAVLCKERLHQSPSY